jgi:hypothetical protein
MPGPLHAPTVLVLYYFRFRDPVSGKWVRTRYVAERHEIEARYKEWEIVGQPEYRRPVGGRSNPGERSRRRRVVRAAGGSSASHPSGRSARVHGLSVLHRRWKCGHGNAPGGGADGGAGRSRCGVIVIPNIGGRRTAMTKAKKVTKSPALTIVAKKGESGEQAIARGSLTPASLAGSLLVDAQKESRHRSKCLRYRAAEAGRRGKVRRLSRLEEMLATQAHALDGLFYSLVNRSRANSAEGYLQAAESYMKLGLRAQAQCRATAEAIAAIKNPAPVAFVRQANISAGPQQVNNGVPPPTQPSRAEKTGNKPNSLLEAINGERLDTRAPGTASEANQRLETVGTNHGPSADGRARVSRNAYKGGTRAILRLLGKALRQLNGERLRLLE